jgi:hypothetical protein
MKLSLRNAGQNVKVSMKCKIRTSVTSDKVLSLCIVFGVQSALPLATATTPPMMMVNYYLALEAKDWEDIWYKDEGGRDKCMLVEVSLRRVDDSPVYNLRVPLKMTLQYDEMKAITVQNQDILRILGPPRQFIDGDSGKALVRFRVEDVSKNHQGQDFRLEIAADPTKFGDVAPISTPSVSVRSKRNKRQRSGVGAQSSDQQSATSGVDTEFGQPSRSAPYTSRHLSSTNREVPPPSTYRHNSPAAPMSQRATTSLAGVPDLTKLRDAMQGVIRWTDEVVNGLYPLQWQVIGYAPFPDGTIDYNHPYHSMPDPNPCISRVLSMYSSKTREDLRTLMNAVEQTLASSPSASRPDRLSQGVLRQTSEENRLGHSSLHESSNPRASAPRAFGQHAMEAAFPAAVARPPLPPQHSRGGGDHLPSLPIPASQLFKPGGVRAQDFEQSSEEIQSQVAYVLAKQYKSLMTGERLGFPAFNMSRDILGFYQESNTKVGMERFVPIHRLAPEFGPMERDQARHILSECIESKSDAVYFIKDFNSVTSLVDNALVYEWTKSYSGGGTARLESPAFS